MAARDLPNLKTFTCGFDLHSASGLELQFDERQAAEFMSYKFHTEHYEMVLKAGDMERCLPKLENEDGPSLRQLIQLAVRRPEAAKGPSASM